MKRIYSAKPYKDGYKISAYTWNESKNRYTDIKTLAFTPDKESALYRLKDIETIEKIENPNAIISWNKTKKWNFLEIEIKEC